MGAVFDHKQWAGKSGPVYGDLAVGDITQLNVDGAATDFLVVHQGNPSSSLYDESCEGTWLLMKDIYEERQWHTAYNNSYAESTIHSYLNSTFLTLLDIAVQKTARQIKIPYLNGQGRSGTVSSGSNGLSTTLFLLSGYEVGYDAEVSQYFPADGAKLDYFEIGNAIGSAARVKRIANLSGSPSLWWLRSPNTYYDTYAWLVGDEGNCGGYRCPGSSGVRPCLIMPANQKIFT